MKKTVIKHPALTALVLTLAIAIPLTFSAASSHDSKQLTSHAASWTGSTFLETFDGQPATPEPFTNISQSNWDIAIHSRNTDTWDVLAPMKAHHGADCSSPLDANNNLVTHPFDGNFDQAVFKCKDHIMTAINGIGRSVHDGYGVIYLTPNALADFSQGEAVIKFDVTTLNQGRDWIDIWITPYDENLQLPFNTGEVDLQNWPKNAVQLTMTNANGQGMGFLPQLYKDFQNIDMGDRGWTIGAYNQWLTPSPQRRDTFEIRISKTGLTMCMPSYNKCFFDKKIFPSPLTWSKGIVQLGHHSYTPDKDNQYAPEPCKSDTSFCADTWHWDNVSIAPAVPFTMIKADKRTVSNTNDTITFNQPAPANAKLRFSGIAKIDLSFNNGASWQPASAQPSERLPNGGTPTNAHMASYFVNIPAGTKIVKFRFTPTAGDTGPFQAKDFAIWSNTASTASPTTPPQKPGDINRDGVVNLTDYVILFDNYGKIPILDPRADLNSDGRVNVIDYSILFENYGR